MKIFYLKDAKLYLFQSIKARIMLKNQGITINHYLWYKSLTRLLPNHSVPCGKYASLYGGGWAASLH
jgi:hypothetical protein